MRCEFSGDEIEGTAFEKDGMNFCSLECSDAMEAGESIPLGEEVLDDPDEYDDDIDEDEYDLDESEDDLDDEDEDSEDEDNDILSSSFNDIERDDF